jgi:hypothetical protein
MIAVRLARDSLTCKILKMKYLFILQAYEGGSRLQSLRILHSVTSDN